MKLLAVRHLLAAGHLCQQLVVVVLLLLLPSRTGNTKRLWQRGRPTHMRQALRLSVGPERQRDTRVRRRHGNHGGKSGAGIDNSLHLRRPGRLRTTLQQQLLLLHLLLLLQLLLPLLLLQELLLHHMLRLEHVTSRGLAATWLHGAHTLACLCRETHRVC